MNTATIEVQSCVENLTFIDMLSMESNGCSKEKYVMA